LGHGPAESLGTIDQVKFRELIRLLEDDVWRLVAQRGSDRQYEHPSKPGKVTVAESPAPVCRRARGEYPSAEAKSWRAYRPDLPGVGPVGDTQEEVERLIREAITFHLDGLRDAREPIP